MEPVVQVEVAAPPSESEKAVRLSVGKVELNLSDEDVRSLARRLMMAVVDHQHDGPVGI